MSCEEILFKILELILTGCGLFVASLVAYYAYQAFKSQSEQLDTLKAQRDDDKKAFEMAKAEFNANQPTLSQIRMNNCPRFQIGALPYPKTEDLSHLIWSGHTTHDQPIELEVSHTISKSDIRDIQRLKKPGPFLQNACLILSNLNPDADLEQWQCEVIGEPLGYTVLFGRIKQCRIGVGAGSRVEAALPDSWGVLLMKQSGQEISLDKFSLKIHFETKTGWQDCHEYEIWPEYARCSRTDPPMMPSYKDPYLDEQVAQ